MQMYILQYIGHKSKIKQNVKRYLKYSNFLNEEFFINKLNRNKS